MGSSNGWRSARTGISLLFLRRSNRLAYVQQIYDTDIWRIEVPNSRGKGSEPTRLIFSSQRDDNPQYSPDGTKVVFGSFRSGSDRSWVCDSDGRNAFRLPLPDQVTRTGSPRWSPDGRSIAFDGTGSVSGVFVVSAEGGGGLPRRLPLRKAPMALCRAGRRMGVGSTSALIAAGNSRLEGAGRRRTSHSDDEKWWLRSC